MQKLINENNKINKIDQLIITGPLVDAPMMMINESIDFTYYCNENEWKIEREKIKNDYLEIKNYLDKSIFLSNYFIIVNIPYIVIPGDKDVYSIFISVFGNITKCYSDENINVL